MGEVGTYGELAAVRAAVEALGEALASEPDGPRAEALESRALEAVRAAQLDRDLGIGEAAPAPSVLVRRGLRYLDELEGGLIPTGLHVPGCVPANTGLVELLVAIDRGPGGGRSARQWRGGWVAVERANGGFGPRVSDSPRRYRGTRCRGGWAGCLLADGATR